MSVRGEQLKHHGLPGGSCSATCPPSNKFFKGSFCVKMFLPIRHLIVVPAAIGFAFPSGTERTAFGLDTFPSVFRAELYWLYSCSADLEGSWSDESDDLLLGRLLDQSASLVPLENSFFAR